MINHVTDNITMNMPLPLPLRCFFSLAAMAVNQTVIVIVPFTALVDDLVLRAKSTSSDSSGSGLTCEEWTHEGCLSGLPLLQLVIVSTDRAVQNEFLHFVKG